MLAAVAIAGAAALTAGCGLGGGASATSAVKGSDGRTQVTMAENQTGAVLFLEIAQKEGIFTKNGLDVTIKPVTNMALMPAAEAANQYDFANIVSPMFVSALSQHLPIMAVAGSNMESSAAPQFGLMVPDASPVHSLADLKGKTVATPTIQGNFSECLNWDLKNKGIDASSVKLEAVPFTDMQSQLAANQVDAALMQNPQPSALEKQGYRSIGDPCSSIGTPQQTAFQVANASWAKANPKIVLAVQKSITEAGQWEKAHPAQAQQLLASFSGIPRSVASAYQIPQVTGTPPTSADLGHWSAAMSGLGVLKSTPSLSGAIFNG